MKSSIITKDQVIDGHHLTFDAADKRNGSLYLCEPLDGPAPFDRLTLLGGLRAAGLWSEAPEKQVPDAQRQAYKEQLQLIEATVYATGAGRFLIARFDHPKFLSDAERWREWQAFFDRKFERADAE